MLSLTPLHHFQILVHETFGPGAAFLGNSTVRFCILCIPDFLSSRLRLMVLTFRVFAFAGANLHAVPFKLKLNPQKSPERPFQSSQFQALLHLSTSQIPFFWLFAKVYRYSVPEIALKLLPIYPAFHICHQ